MNIGHLKTFVAVIENGSFNQAAESLHISRAAVTQQIQLLEAKLGVSLIKRTTRRLFLTDAGEQLFQVAKQVLEDLTEVEALIGQEIKLAQGSLRVTSNPYFARRFILPYLGQFMDNYPDINLSLFLEERLPDLEKEKIDILLGVSVEGPQDLVRKKILSTRYVFCAAPDYLLKQGEPLKPHELISHQYITHGMRRPDHIISFKGNEEITVQPSLRLNDAEAMVMCASQGLGIVKLHDYMVADRIKKGELVEILKSYNEGTIPLYVYFKKQKNMPAKIRAFMDFVEENIRL